MSLVSDRVARKDLGFAHQHVRGDAANSEIGLDQLVLHTGPFGHVCRHDLEQIVDISADGGCLHNLRQPCNCCFEPRLLIAVSALQDNLDIEYQAYAEPEGIEPGVIALDDTVPIKAPDARKAGARRKADAFRHRLVGQAAFSLNEFQDLSVDPVQWNIRCHCRHTAESAESVNIFEATFGGISGRKAVKQSALLAA
jgi:hypothetical protein